MIAEKLLAYLGLEQQMGSLFFLSAVGRKFSPLGLTSRAVEIVLWDAWEGNGDTDPM